MGKLPYIADKKLYAAVMGACSYIKETGWFNKAVNYYAKKYDVSADEIAKYVRIAQGNGQKAKNKVSPKRKYKWFAVEYSWGCDNIPYFTLETAEYKVMKGTKLENVIDRIDRERTGKYTFSTFPILYIGRTQEFETEDEAKQRCNEWWYDKKQRKESD